MLNGILPSAFADPAATALWNHAIHSFLTASGASGLQPMLYVSVSVLVQVRSPEWMTENVCGTLQFAPEHARSWQLLLVLYQPPTLTAHETSDVVALKL
jgi:hypothetical protein